MGNITVEAEFVADIPEEKEEEENTEIFSLQGILFRSTHIKKTSKPFKREKNEPICLFNKFKQKEKCLKTDVNAKFTFSGLTPGESYYLKATEKRKVYKKYYDKRYQYYKKKYENTKIDWEKKFHKKYRVLKKKDKANNTDLSYYRRYRVMKKFSYDGDKVVRVYMR